MSGTMPSKEYVSEVWNVSKIDEVEEVRVERDYASEYH